MKDHLRVRSGGKDVAFGLQARPQGREVVHLSVKYDGQFARLVIDGLVSALHIDDG